jgi:hypothetical protein
VGLELLKAPRSGRGHKQMMLAANLGRFEDVATGFEVVVPE